MPERRFHSIDIVNASGAALGSRHERASPVLWCSHLCFESHEGYAARASQEQVFPELNANLIESYYSCKFQRRTAVFWDHYMTVDWELTEQPSHALTDDFDY